MQNIDECSEHITIENMIVEYLAEDRGIEPVELLHSPL